MKKISLKKFLQSLFDIKNGEAKSIRVYNKDASGYAEFGSEGEEVYARLMKPENADEKISTMYSFDDCLFYATEREMFYIKDKKGN